MNYKQYDMGSFHLHVIPTKRFKTVGLKVNFKRPARKEEITIRNFLNQILLESTHQYQGRRELAIETENLYNVSCGIRSSLSGNYVLTIFDAMMLHEKYTEPGMMKKSIQFFLEMLLHPDVENGAFKKEPFELIKTTLTNQIKSANDAPTHYATEKMLEHLDPTLPLSYHIHGYLEDLEKITPQNLYEYYKSMIHSDVIDIFVCGDVNPEEVKMLFQELFTVNTLKRKISSHYITHKKIRKRSRSFKESKKLKQSTLSIGCKMTPKNDFERFYVGYIYNMILGGSSDSKLFRIVREKHSLCYTVNSRYLNVNSLLLITAGINKEDYKKTVSLIKRQLKAMIQGNFKEEEVEKAKTIYISGCKELFDSPSAIINTYISYVYLHVDDVETRIQKIKEVTKEDVVKFAKNVYLDTIFLLEGDLNE